MKLLSCITYECMDIECEKNFGYVNSVSSLCLHLRDIASVVIQLGLEVEALEEPLYVSSPLGIRARIGMICRSWELEISGILLTVDLRVMVIRATVGVWNQQYLYPKSYCCSKATTV